MTVNQILTYQIHELNDITNKTKKIKLRISKDNSMYIIHRSLVKQMTEVRQGTAHSKNRSEVRGGGRKPWKQKGTGKARAGSIRSPLWRGGGVIFGPKFKVYNKKLNAKEKRLAICNLLFNKKSHTIVLPDKELKLDQPKTQILNKKIQALNLKLNQKTLIIVKKKHTNLYLASRNISNIELILADQINVISLLTAKNIVISTAALSTIEEVYNGN